MKFKIREVNPESDFIQLAPILSEAWAEPISLGYQPLPGVYRLVKQL